MKKAISILLCLMLLVTAASAETFVVGYNPTPYTYCDIMIRDDGTALTPAGTYSLITALTPGGTPEADCLYAAREVNPNAGEEEDFYNGDPLEPCALMNAEGQLITGFDYMDLTYLDKDLLRFKSSDALFGVIDTTGKEILPAEYAGLLRTDKGYLALDAKGIGYDYDTYYPLVYIDDAGHARETGLHVKPFWSDDSGSVIAINQVREYDDGAVYVDGEGNLCFDGRVFDYADPFTGRLASYRIGEVFGVIDIDGSDVTDPEVSYMCQVYRSNNRDANNSEMPGKSLMVVMADEYVRVFDCDTGALLVETTAEDCDNPFEFYNGLMFEIPGAEEEIMFALDGSPCLVIPEGRIINVNYEGRCDAMPDRYVEYLDGAAQLVDASFEPVGGTFDYIYPEIVSNGHSYFITTTYSGRSELAEGLYGVCDENGNVLLDCVYEALTMLSPKCLWATREGKTGMIDLQGNLMYTLD